MSDAARALLQDLSRRGVTLESTGTTLRVHGPTEHLTDADYAAIKAAKADLLGLCAGDAPWDADRAWAHAQAAEVTLAVTWDRLYKAMTPQRNAIHAAYGAQDWPALQRACTEVRALAARIEQWRATL